MTYNMTALQNAETVGQLIIYASNSTGNLLFGLGTVALFIIMMAAFLRSAEFDEALLTSSFISFVLSFFLIQGKLISVIFVIAYLALTAFSAFYIYVIKK